MGNLISLVQWAERNGVGSDSARQKANRGGFQTARKIGRNWVIDEDEPRVNLRRRTPGTIDGKKQGEAKQKTIERGDNA